MNVSKGKTSLPSVSRSDRCRGSYQGPFTQLYQALTLHHTTNALMSRPFPFEPGSLAASQHPIRGAPFRHPISPKETRSNGLYWKVSCSSDAVSIHFIARH
jgi:hypothetical protein